MLWVESHPPASGECAGLGGRTRGLDVEATLGDLAAPWPLPTWGLYLGHKHALHPPADGELEGTGVSAPLHLRFSGW